MIKIEYHSDLKEVQSDSQLAPLLSEAAQRAPFDRLAWWQLLEKHCGISPVLAAATDGENTAILALTAGEDGQYASLANWYTFRFRPIVSGDLALLSALAHDLGRISRRITLWGVPGEDGSADLLETAFKAAGWLTVRTVCDTNHVLSVSRRTSADYIAGRPGKLRTTLKRKSGKVETKILTHFDEKAWAAYEDIYAESWKPEEGSPAFLRAFAEQEGAAGRLRMGIACTAGEAIAAQMWTVEGATAFIHKLAHREAAKPLSPGSVLTAALFRHVIDLDGVDLVDFGTGDDPYKRDWMENAHPRFKLDMFRPAKPANWPALARIGVRKLAASRKRG